VCLDNSIKNFVYLGTKFIASITSRTKNTAIMSQLETVLTAIWGNNSQAMQKVIDWQASLKCLPQSK
jgi:hypothetical protein